MERRNVTLMGEKPTITTLGAKSDILAIVQKAPVVDLPEVLGDILACVVFSSVPAAEQDRVVDLIAAVIKNRIQIAHAHALVEAAAEELNHD